MNPAAKILNRCHVLHVRFRSAEEYTAEMLRFRYARGSVETDGPETVDDLHAALAQSRRLPLLLAFSGYGVISKQEEGNAELLEKVTSADGGFVWSRADGTVSFLRRAQAGGIMQKLKEARVLPVAMCCVPAGGQAGEFAAERALAFFMEGLRPKALFHPSGEGSWLCRLLAQRLHMPVLCAVLGALVVNFLVSGGVRDAYNVAGVRLAAAQNDAQKDEGRNARRQKAVADLDRLSSVRWSFLCDRAALVVPEGMILRTVALQPALKSTDRGKTLQLAERRAQITGLALSPDDVSDYASALQKLKICQQVRLTSVLQDRDSGMLSFTIELNL